MSVTVEATRKAAVALIPSRFSLDSFKIHHGLF